MNGLGSHRDKESKTIQACEDQTGITHLILLQTHACMHIWHMWKQSDVSQQANVRKCLFIYVFGSSLATTEVKALPGVNAITKIKTNQTNKTSNDNSNNSNSKYLHYVWIGWKNIWCSWRSKTQNEGNICLITELLIWLSICLWGVFTTFEQQHRPSPTIAEWVALTFKSALMSLCIRKK